jgi:hypothetical protein
MTSGKYIKVVDKIPSLLDFIKFRQSELFVLLLGVLSTISAWFLASFLEDSGAGKIWVEASRDVAAFTLSITIFDSVKEFIFRRENENDKALLLSEATTRFERIIDANKNISENGIAGVQGSLDIACLKEIILSLEPGDCLYCHDGSISDFSAVKQAIINKASIGVKFKFMALAPYCMNAIRRAQEVGKEVDIYSSRCKEFDNDIKDIRSQIKENNLTCLDNVQIQLYRSLMSIPFYLVERNEQLKTALTGFYLSKASSNSIHIRWEAREASRNMGYSHGQLDNILIRELWDYWNFKWTEGCKEYTRSKFWEGKWTYVSFDHDHLPVYEGECEITEEAGSLRAEGIRLKTISNGESIETRINWETEIMHKYTKEDNQHLIMAHKCYPQSGDMTQKGVQAFVCLEAMEGDVLSATPDKLVGEFFVTAPPGLPFFDVQTGRVEFKRSSSC